MADILETLFTSKSRVAILRLFMDNESKGFYLREISRLTNINSNQAKRELDKLTDVGLLTKTTIGKTVTYSIDKKFLFYGELKSIVAKTSKIEVMLKKELGQLKGLEILFIFGSYADNTYSSKSDIDLLIIGRPDMNYLNHVITALEGKINRSIQYVVYPKEEFNKKKGVGFIKNVLKGKKIFIKGSEDELG